MSNQTKALYIAHGGGPLPLLGDEQHEEMNACLRQIVAEIPRPSAIVLVSAHWEATQTTVTSGATPSLIYDYYGFPPESYDIQYPCAGAPALAERVFSMLSAEGITAQRDSQRGFDHGLFVPLKLMYPDADIPCIQLSLLASMNPADHIALGRAISSLWQDNVLVLGSGSSFHNMQAFFAQETAQSRQLNVDFEGWLERILCDTELTEQARSDALANWEQAPGARYCHPREEHLLPLHVCYGAGQGPSRKRYAFTGLGKEMSMYLW